MNVPPVPHVPEHAAAPHEDMQLGVRGFPPIPKPLFDSGTHLAEIPLVKWCGLDPVEAEGGALGPDKRDPCTFSGGKGADHAN
eukprot:2468331-Alexandrium_andersonii.AAC.1